MKNKINLLLSFSINSRSFAPAFQALLTTSFSLYFSFVYHTLMDTFLVLYITGSPKKGTFRQLLLPSPTSPQLRQKTFCNFKRSKASTSALFALFCACYCLQMFLLKRRRKIGKAIKTRRSVALAPRLSRPLHNISFPCNVNAAIISIFLLLHNFYLEKSYCK